MAGSPAAPSASEAPAKAVARLADTHLALDPTASKKARQVGA
jgi:hypothetical protein